MNSHAHTVVQDAGELTADSVAVVDEHEVDFFHLFWIFVIASFGGLVVETVVSYPIDGVWKNRAGLLWGPFSPIYGVGAVLMTAVLSRFRDKSWVVTFLCAALIGGSFELFAGMFWEEAFGFVAWDYSDQFLNIRGKTCLGISLVWGLLGIIWMKALLPVVIQLINLIPEDLRRGLTRICFAFMVLDVMATFAAFECWFDRAAGVPVEGAVSEFFARFYNDDFMSSRFETISMFPVLANR